ncbi:MAG: transglutaminase family protein [Burkholderiales bacterium]|nr:transglutaminase family protein [Burkholderiales bacterium]
MLLHVLHETQYEYLPPVRTAQHMVHLTPASDGRQRLLGHAIRIAPDVAQRSESVDLYGNRRTFFSLKVPHDSLAVVADSLVETSEPLLPDADLTWEEGRERVRYHRTAHYDPAAEFVFASPYVPRHDDFIAYAAPSFGAGRPLLDAARELASRIHADFTYKTAVTDVGTPALEALSLRKGVCQDFAHVMIGCLRSLGLPARYISGYLLTEPPPGRPRLVGSDASHAWVAVYCGEGRWAELDPTNDRPAGEDYVRLAMGRDFSDVSPMRGVIHGGASHTLKVAVTVTPAQ